MRVSLEYAHTVDPAKWRASHAAGLVPDRLPYGLDRLSETGVHLVERPAPARALRALNRSARFLSGGFDLALAAGSAERRECDVALCWDERSGVPASLRSRLRGEPPTATGVIWATEPTTSTSRRAQYIAHRALRNAAAVWALSPAQLPILAERFGIARPKLHLLHMGIDVDFWYSDREPEPELVVAAGNDRHRDHARLVAAMARVHRRRPTARLELVTHQPVPVPDELGLRHPTLTHTQMRDLYRRASIVALAVRPNFHISGLSVLLEAMASGRPVVMTESPGLSEYIRHDETGVIVPSGEVEDLALAIEALLAEPERAAELGAAARARVMHFSTSAQATALKGILESCQ